MAEEEPVDAGEAKEGAKPRSSPFKKKKMGTRINSNRPRRKRRVVPTGNQKTLCLFLKRLDNVVVQTNTFVGRTPRRIRPTYFALQNA